MGGDGLFLKYAVIVLLQLQHTAPKSFVGVVPYCIPFPRVPSVSIVSHTPKTLFCRAHF